MTEQQMEMIKRLSDKYEISIESLDKTLLLLGVGYGLDETQIEEYLSLGDGKLMEKHLCMICSVLGLEKPVVDLDVDSDSKIVNETDRDYFQEQLEQLRLAASAGMPEKDVLMLASAGKEPMEVRRCVEFYEMVHKVKKKKRVFGWKKSFFFGTIIICSILL